MPGYEYGEATDPGELDAVGDVLCRAFNVPPDRWSRWRDNVGPGSFRCVRRGGRAVGGLCLLDFGQWFGGRCVPMAGIAAVGIAPGDRGEGAGSALMAGTVREVRARGTPLSGSADITQPGLS